MTYLYWGFVAFSFLLGIVALKKLEFAKGYKEGHKEGRTEGYYAGFEDGKSEGKIIGHEQGHEQGFQRGRDLAKQEQELERMRRNKTMHDKR